MSLSRNEEAPSSADHPWIILNRFIDFPSGSFIIPWPTNQWVMNQLNQWTVLSLEKIIWEGIALSSGQGEATNVQLNKDKSMTGNLKISLIMPRSYKTKSLRALRGLYYAGTLDGALFIGGGGLQIWGQNNKISAIFERVGGAVAPLSGVPVAMVFMNQSINDCTVCRDHRRPERNPVLVFEHYWHVATCL